MNHRLRIVCRLLILGAMLPALAQAGFGFGFDSDNGFYDYNPEHYPWGYPPPGYRDDNPRWYWGTREEPSTWRFGSRPEPKPRDKGKSWDRSWSFGDWGDDNTSRFSFGPQRFHFGDRWTPSFGDRWGKGRYRYPYAPYPGWGWTPPPPGYAPPPPPGWRPYPPPPRPGVKAEGAPTPPAKASPRPPAQAPEARQKTDGVPSAVGEAAGKAAKGNGKAPAKTAPPAGDGDKAGESAPAPAEVKA